MVGVETLELPASTTSLDTVLRVRPAGGQEYLHLVEWQGYPDPLFLWRTLGYLAWLGQNRPERPILATVIYLSPRDDAGDSLVQALDGQHGWSVTLPCVRLWEQDAAAALASGAPGLMTLIPLMHGATEDLVEQAARSLIAEVAPPIQGELLAALGVFAEAVMPTEQFIQLITKERLMATDLISSLMQDKVAEHEQQVAVWRQALQESVEDVIIARFPTVPAMLTRKVRTVNDPVRLQRLHQAVLAAADLTEVERLLNEAAGA